jgi:hypothetical protein
MLRRPSTAKRRHKSFALVIENWPRELLACSGVINCWLFDILNAINLSSSRGVRIVTHYSVIKLALQLNRLGPKLLFNGGIFTVGTCAMMFGWVAQPPQTLTAYFCCISQVSGQDWRPLPFYWAVVFDQDRGGTRKRRFSYCFLCHHSQGVPR